MKTMNFTEFDREMLEDIFGLIKKRDYSKILIDWIENSKIYSIDEFENKYLIRHQEVLKDRVDFWNEQELIENFVSPIFSLVQFNGLEYGYFSERTLTARIDDIELTGKPDAIIAKGKYSPKIPYFCFHEYKKEQENKGDPQGQCLAAMLVAQELNKNEKPIYGVVVKGMNWYIMVLQGKEYAISNSYKATDEELFEIVKLLKHLKTIIEEYVKS